MSDEATFEVEMSGPNAKPKLKGDGGHKAAAGSGPLSSLPHLGPIAPIIWLPVVNILFSFVLYRRWCIGPYLDLASMSLCTNGNLFAKPPSPLSRLISL